MRKLIALLLCLVFCVTACVIPCYADDYIVTATVDNNTRVLTISGKINATPGTNVFLAVCYPDKDLLGFVPNASNITEIADIVFTVKQVTLDGDQGFTYSVTLPKDEASGIYKIYVSPYGDSLNEVEVRYLSATRIDEIMALVASSTLANQIYAKLDAYACDIDIDYGNIYKALTTSAKQYIANGLFASRPADKDELISDFNTAVEQYAVFNKMKAANRDELKKLLDNNYGKFALNSSDVTDYLAFNAERASKVIVKLFSEMSSCAQPTDLTLAFARAVAAAKTPTTGNDASPSAPQGPSGSSSSNSNAPIGDNTAVIEPTDDSFTDLGSVEWARPAIAYWVNKGVLNGKGDGKFAPNDYVTREEFVKMAVLAFNFPIVASDKTFDDVKAEDWFNKYVHTAVKYGIINGISDTLFGTGGNITRQDMTTVLYRAIEADGTIEMYPVKTTVDFTDMNLVSDYAVEAVSGLYKSNLINGMGDGTFAPLANCTRAEAAVALYKVLYK